MIRATLYLLAAGVIWFIEGFLFSQFLAFSRVQIAVAAMFYAVLYGLVMTQLLRTVRRDIAAGDVAQWRHLTLAPMLTVVLGSFVSLPILLLIVALGKVV